MDLIALWIGRIVMGFGAGLFVIGGLLILSDHYGRMLWKRLQAVKHLRDMTEAEFNKAIDG